MVPLPSLPLPVISLSRIKDYAQASGDFNPIHTDPEAARLSGFPGVIAHGMLVMGMAGYALAEWFPGRKLRFWHAAFVDFVFSEERLYVCGSCHSVRLIAYAIRLKAYGRLRTRRDESSCPAGSSWLNRRR